jgi:hypothetical protein
LKKYVHYVQLILLPFFRDLAEEKCVVISHGTMPQSTSKVLSGGTGKYIY